MPVSWKWILGGSSVDWHSCYPLFNIDIPSSSECIGLVLSFPGWKWIMRLNPERYSDQCACQCMRILVIEKYCKFQWSVTTSIGSAEPSGNVAIVWKLQKLQVALCHGHCSWFPELKISGVECNWVQFTFWSHDWKDSSKCIVRGISLNCNLSVWDPMGKDWSCGESLFKCFKGRMALIGKVPGCTLVFKEHKWNGDFRISINENNGRNWQNWGKIECPWLSGVPATLDDLDFVQGHGEAFQGQHVSKIFTGTGMDSHLSAQTKSPLVQSLQSTSQTWALCSEMLLE